MDSVAIVMGFGAPAGVPPILGRERETSRRARDGRAILGDVPSLRPRRVTSARPASGPAIAVLGDLALDVVVAPNGPLVGGTDVPGRVSLRQGGSAATTARVAATLGARVSFVTSVGRDAVGRSLVADLTSAGVGVRAFHATAVPTARIAVVVSDGERSFVADRGAADALPPAHLEPAWFRRADLLHLPAYSLIGRPLAEAALRAVELTRAAGGVVSLDLASAGPLAAGGREAARRLVRSVAPDLVFATAAEADVVRGAGDFADLLELAPVVVIKRGSDGASVLARRDVAAAPVIRFDVATRPFRAADPTGGGDAFDAGFLVAWLRVPRDRWRSVAALRRGAVAGNAAAGRYLASRRRELVLG
ncbi:MAG TPA: PfkB family carbohydrate kinase [Candidatus Limnocylindrales bacterium]